MTAGPIEHDYDYYCPVCRPARERLALLAHEQAIAPKTRDEIENSLNQVTDRIQEVIDGGTDLARHGVELFSELRSLIQQAERLGVSRDDPLWVEIKDQARRVSREFMGLRLPEKSN